MHAPLSDCVVVMMMAMLPVVPVMVAATSFSSIVAPPHSNCGGREGGCADTIGYRRSCIEYFDETTLCRVYTHTRKGLHVRSRYREWWRHRRTRWMCTVTSTIIVAYAHYPIGWREEGRGKRGERKRGMRTHARTHMHKFTESLYTFHTARMHN